MLRLKKVAVTGSISSGKTTVCRILQKLGAYVISADEIVHQLLTPTTDLGKEIIALLGDDLVVGEKLNREAIAQKVFRDPSLLKKLEKRIHPEVQKVIETQYQQISKKNYPVFVAEIPLFFESSLFFESDYDIKIFVYADEERRKQRFTKATHYGKDEFDRRQKRLIPDEQKKARADIVIENNGSFESLQQAVEIIFNSLKENV
ncbi:MAG: dephospho-CoA kinase [Chlamydiales bacterium]